ncbi:MAG: hypothetical protein CMJ83_07240 [Planctomycetes bacterium]|nr:hypothetical protein [Planctomycetota bacterium]
MSHHLELHVRQRSRRLIVVLLMAIAAMLFAAFTGALLIRRTGADWSPVPLPGILWATTAVIALSSVTMEVARRKASRGWLGVTMALAFLFLAGQVLAYRSLASDGYADPRIIHGAFFVTLCAVHAVHVLGGLTAMVYARRRPAILDVCTTYWHFVGVVWVYLYFLLSVA